MPLLFKNIYSFAFHLEEDVNFSPCVKGPTCSTRMSPPTAPPLLALCDPYSLRPPTLASPALSHRRTRSLTVPIVWALCPDRYMHGWVLPIIRVSARLSRPRRALSLHCARGSPGDAVTMPAWAPWCGVWAGLTSRVSDELRGPHFE